LNDRLDIFIGNWGKIDERIIEVAGKKVMKTKTATITEKRGKITQETNNSNY